MAVRSPTSRAFWELKAEQVLDRVFDEGESPIDVSLQPGPDTAGENGRSRGRSRTAPPSRPRPGTVASLAERRAARDPSQPQRQGLILAVGLLGGGAAIAAMLAWNGWRTAQADLRQQRTLLVLERMRTLKDGEGDEAPSDTAAATTAAPAAATAMTAGSRPLTAPMPQGSLPPPPVEEPWMQEIAPLQVPLHGTLQTAPAPQIPAQVPPQLPPEAMAAAPPAMSGPLPELVGVVQSPQGSSAIFQVGGTSTSAGVGESIASSGWRLVSAGNDEAVIERNGQRQRVSISGF